MARVLVVEEQFRGVKSHHFAYQSAIATGARELGIDLDLLVNRKAGMGDLAVYGALGKQMRPVLWSMAALSMNGEEGISNRVLRGALIVRNVFANALAIKRELDRGKHYDLLLCPTAWLPQVAVFILLRVIVRRNLGVLALLFVQYPKTSTRPALVVRLIKGAVNLLCALHPETKIFAETRYAQKAWGDLLARPVGYLVHPVDAEQLPMAEGGERTADFENQKIVSSGYSISDLRHSPSGEAKPVVFGFYGFARHEQGVDVLMRALEVFQSSRWFSDAEFRIVWPTPFRMPDGSWMAPRMFAHLAPNVKFMEHALPPEDYARALAATDWLVLPYRVGSYLGRCSRISIEACVLGIPAVYTRGTDLGEVLGLHGAGIAVPDEDPARLASALESAVRNHSHFKSSALAKRESAASNFSGRKILRQIFDEKALFSVN